MKFSKTKQRIGAMLAVATLAAIISASSAAAISKDDSPAAVMTFSKSGNFATGITFSTNDFRVIGSKNISLDSIVLTSLPMRETGSLMLGDELLATGDVIAHSALDGIHFSPLNSSTVFDASFTFTPVFSSGESGSDVEVHLYILNEENRAPTAENIEFYTYKNVAYTGRFSAVDPEGDLITFQIIDKPARGAVTFSENNEAEFVYTPYENKIGKDSFTYVAIDAMGNTSREATVKIQIEKPATKVSYADMDGHPACNAALRLAEENIFIGPSMNGIHYFQPNSPVTRIEFLTMVMEALDKDVSAGITVTGFYDDDAIQTWAKPYVASALKTGCVQGSISADGKIVFCADNAITHTEAAVLLDRMLNVSDVSVETWGGDNTLIPSWACQAVMTLESAGVLCETSDYATLSNGTVTRADAAQMLSSALDLLQMRAETQNWFRY